MSRSGLTSQGTFTHPPHAGPSASNSGEKGQLASLIWGPGAGGGVCVLVSDHPGSGSKAALAKGRAGPLQGSRLSSLSRCTSWVAFVARQARVRSSPARSGLAVTTGWLGHRHSSSVTVWRSVARKPRMRVLLPRGERQGVVRGVSAPFPTVSGSRTCCVISSPRTSFAASSQHPNPAAEVRGAQPRRPAFPQRDRPSSK